MTEKHISPWTEDSAWIWIVLLGLVFGLGLVFFHYQASSVLSTGLAQDHKQGYFKNLFLTCGSNDWRYTCSDPIAVSSFGDCLPSAVGNVPLPMTNNVKPVKNSNVSAGPKELSQMNTFRVVCWLSEMKAKNQHLPASILSQSKDCFSLLGFQIFLFV